MLCSQEHDVELSQENDRLDRHFQAVVEQYQANFDAAADALNHIAAGFDRAVASMVVENVRYLLIEGASWFPTRYLSHARTCYLFTALRHDVIQDGSSADMSNVEAAATALTAACAAKLQSIKDAHMQGAQQLEQSLQAAKSLHRQRVVQRIAERRAQQSSTSFDESASGEEKEEAEPSVDASFEAECVEAMLAAQSQVETLMMDVLSTPADQAIAQSMQEAHKVRGDWLICFCGSVLRNTDGSLSARQTTIEVLQSTLSAEQHKSAEKLQQRLQRRRDRLRQEFQHRKEEMRAETQAEQQTVDVSTVGTEPNHQDGAAQGDAETQREVQTLKQQHEQRRREDQEALNSRQVRAVTVPPLSPISRARWKRVLLNSNRCEHAHNALAQAQQKAKLQERLAAKKALREAEISAQQQLLKQRQEQQKHGQQHHGQQQPSTDQAHRQAEWRSALLQDLQQLKSEGASGQDLEERVFNRNAQRYVADRQAPHTFLIGRWRLTPTRHARVWPRDVCQIESTANEPVGGSSAACDGRKAQAGVCPADGNTVRG